eukprot:TRINITY_DN3350_c0_g1_i1.p1 TRINITY_DN3350_c0_g1~~TRINITY_DN3350_c0_g1_i1.p1  ORF type:complete len:819 (+),score=245.65 TRINITY_DN3350_c0_g1_i1:178-2457(+)
MAGRFGSSLSDNAMTYEQRRTMELHKRRSKYLEEFQSACNPWFEEKDEDDKRTSAQLALAAAARRAVDEPPAKKRKKKRKEDEPPPGQVQRVQVYTADGKLTSTKVDSMEAVVCLNCLCIGHMIKQCDNARVTLPDTICRKHLSGMCEDPCPHGRRHVGHAAVQRFVSRAVDGIMSKQFGRAAVPDSAPPLIGTAAAGPAGRAPPQPPPAAAQQEDDDADMAEAAPVPGTRIAASTIVANTTHSPAPGDDAAAYDGEQVRKGVSSWAHAAVAAGAARLVRRFPDADMAILTAVFGSCDGDEELGAQKLRDMGCREVQLGEDYLGAMSAAAAYEAAAAASREVPRARRPAQAKSLFPSASSRGLAMGAKRGYLVPLRPWIRKYMLLAYAMRCGKSRYAAAVAATVSLPQEAARPRGSKAAASAAVAAAAATSALAWCEARRAFLSMLLSGWRRDFVCRMGRRPTKRDIRADEDLEPLYQEYQRLPSPPPGDRPPQQLPPCVDDRSESPEMEEAVTPATPAPRTASTADWALEGDMLQFQGVGRVLAEMMYDPLDEPGQPVLEPLVNDVETHTLLPTILKRRGGARLYYDIRSALDPNEQESATEPAVQLLRRMLELGDTVRVPLKRGRSDIADLLIRVETHENRPQLLRTTVGGSRHQKALSELRATHYGAFRIEAQSVLRMLENIGLKQPPMLQKLRTAMSRHPSLRKFPGIENRLHRVDECEQAGDFEGAMQLIQTTLAQLDHRATTTAVWQTYAKPL